MHFNTYSSSNALRWGKLRAKLIWADTLLHLLITKNEHTASPRNHAQIHPSRPITRRCQCTKATQIHSRLMMLVDVSLTVVVGFHCLVCADLKRLSTRKPLRAELQSELISRYGREREIGLGISLRYFGYLKEICRISRDISLELSGPRTNAPSTRAPEHETPD
jgi:hypothetical protein